MFKWLDIIIFFSDRYDYFNFYKVVTVACSMLLRAAINMQMDALICPTDALNIQMDALNM